MVRNPPLASALGAPLCHKWPLRRREFIKGIAVSAAACPFAARAQKPAPPIVGYLSSRGATEDAPFLAAFLRGLNENGYTQGRNVVVEYRFANDHYDRLTELAYDLVGHHASVLMTGGAPAGPATAKAVTTSIPIVFVTGGDPVAAGLVESLDHPGGNLTGVNVLNTELSAKRLQLLHEIVPSAGTVAVLVNPKNPNAAKQLTEFHSAAQAVGSQLHVIRASTEAELDAAFDSAAKLAAGGIVIGSDAFLNGQSRKLGALAINHSMPAVFSVRDFAVAGGLASYGASIAEAFRVAGHYVARILNGERPDNLPVQQSTRVELVINLKTARALGLTIPLPLLGRADEVIE